MYVTVPGHHGGPVSQGLGSWWNPLSWFSSGEKGVTAVYEGGYGPEGSAEGPVGKSVGTGQGWLNKIFSSGFFDALGKLFSSPGGSTGTSPWASVFGSGGSQPTAKTTVQTTSQANILGMPPLVFALVAIAAGGALMWFATKDSGGVQPMFYMPAAPEPRPSYRRPPRRAPSRPTAKRTKKQTRGKRR